MTFLDQDGFSDFVVFDVLNSFKNTGLTTNLGQASYSGVVDQHIMKSKMCVFVFVCLCVCVRLSHVKGSHEDQKSASDPLELGLQIVMNCYARVPQTKVKSSARPVCALNLRAISAATSGAVLKGNEFFMANVCLWLGLA